ncbi:MAG TPA: hypothetical protein VGB26_08990 [Nitrospiria bacterium]|jgi:rubredoxin
MGPTKVIIKGKAIFDGKNGKKIKDGLNTPKALKEFAAHHYISLPVLDNLGKPWLVNEKPVYCLRGTKYETLDDEVVHLTRCPDCGGMGINIEEPALERDCIQCTQCGHEFDARLEMMES